MRGYLLIVIAVGIVAVMTALEGYTGIVRYLGRESMAKVTEYRQDPPGRIIPGDWRMRYRFSTGDGRYFSGETIFARNNRPHESVESVRILYLPANPKISEVKGYESITGLLGYSLAILAIAKAIPFLRSGNGAFRTSKPKRVGL